MALADIDTIIVVIMENRSFDHMLGYLSLPGAGQMTVEGLRGDDAWLAAHANLQGAVAYRSERLERTVQAFADHGRAAIAVQIGTPAQGGGPMGGFVKSYVEDTQPTPPDPRRVMGYYDAGAAPVFDFFARNFAVCDHWFAALPCGTQPNRLMAMAGESRLADNAGLLLPDQYLVYDWLSDHAVSWCAYQWGGFFPFFSLNSRFLPKILTSLTLTPGGGRFRRYSHFAAQWASDEDLPRVIFIEPEYGDGPHSDPNDDHPPTGISNGQAFLADIYTTLISNPARWARTMMVVTYDEHGGFFDHVPPLRIPAEAGGIRFETTGVRVPAFVISPQVGAGQVFDRPLDHTSILQLFDDRFSPGAGYSLAVNARQGSLDRIANGLGSAPAAPRMPQIPHETTSALRAAAAVPPRAPPLGASPDHPANAQALHQVAVKAEAEHPDLMADPHWDAVRAYLETAG